MGGVQSMNRLPPHEELCAAYLARAETKLESVQKMSAPKFNDKQCKYLVHILMRAVESARELLEYLMWIRVIPENFKLLLALAKQIESFVQGCCSNAWVEAAMTLSNVEEYVSSLAFNIQLCRVTFEGLLMSRRGLSCVELDDMYKVEADLVETMAYADVECLLEKLKLETESSVLAKYLIQRLLRSAQSDPSFFNKLFNWVSNEPEEQIGRGASATVYKVKWLGTPVAKKTFLGPNNPDFLREVAILSRLCHPNITSMFCSQMNKKNCSIIMELMDEDLYSLMQKRCEGSGSAPFSTLEAVDVMLQVGEGVNYLHNNRIIHRDLKSMNILVKNLEEKLGFWQVKVVDFGLSKTKEASTTNSNISYNTGSDRWMAPEIIKMVVDGQEIRGGSEELAKHKFKCDIYSFAMVCYEILTGEVPFKDEASNRKVKKMVLDDMRPEIPDGCPPILKALIEKCWSKEAEERPNFDTICSMLRYVKYSLMRVNCTSSFSSHFPEGIELVQKSGAEWRYRAGFGPIAEDEQLRKTHACYLSTSRGPIAGTLYISNLKFAFCSDRLLQYASTPLETARWSYCKIVVPLQKVIAVVPSFNETKPAEKSIQVVTKGWHDFWCVGFVNYDKAVTDMQNIGVVDPNGARLGMKVPRMKRTGQQSLAAFPLLVAPVGHIPTDGIFPFITAPAELLPPSPFNIAIPTWGIPGGHS